MAVSHMSGKNTMIDNKYFENEEMIEEVGDTTSVEEEERWTLENACQFARIQDISLQNSIREKYAWAISQLGIPENAWNFEEEVENRLTVYTMKHKRNSIFRSEIMAHYPMDLLIGYVKNQKQR